MPNKIRARDRQPFDLEDGVSVNGVLLSSPQGASQIGIATPAGLTATNLQDAITQLKASSGSATLTDVALTGVSSVPTATVGTNTTQIANTAFFAASSANVKITPTVGAVVVTNITGSGCNLAANITSVNGYSMSSVTLQFQTTPQSTPNAWSNVGSVQVFTNTSTAMSATIGGLSLTTAYFARAILIDSNNPTLSVVSATSSFTTTTFSNDADSAFDIVGGSYTTNSVIGTNATVSSTLNNAVATSNNAFATTLEMAQQNGQGQFTSITPVVSFRPNKLNVLATSTTSVLSLTTNVGGLVTGNQLYTVESGALQKRTPLSITSAYKGNLNAYHKHNNVKASTVADITGWTAGPALSSAIMHSGAVVTNSRVYLVGGALNAAAATTVQYAPIDSAGVIGTWVAGPALPAALSNSCVVVINGIIYAIGGVDGSNVRVGTVYASTIAADGSVGSWSQLASLPTGVAFAQPVVTNSRIYILGGEAVTNTPLSIVYYANINSDGSLGAWTVGTALPAALSSSQAVVTNSRVYLLGGSTAASTYTANVYYAPIDQFGVIGTWVAGSALPANTAFHQAVMTAGRVYLLGSYIGAAQLTTVYTAPVDVNGIIGGWSTGTALSAALAGSQAVVTNTRVYLLGGNTASANMTSGTVSNTYYAAFADGWLGVNGTNAIGKSYLNRYSSQNINKVTTVNDITGWTTGTSLPATVAYSQAIVTNSRVYMLGGTISGADSAVVYTAPINADGTLGTWTTGTSLPATVAYSQAIVTNSRVYLLGGYVSGTYSAVVYTAPINSDGTLGTWTTGTSLPATVAYSQAIVTNSRVYLLGGQISGAASAVVYTAPINSDGTLGTWTTGTSLPGTIYQSQSIVTNSRVYLLGGQISGAASAVVYTAPINSDGTLGTWTTGTSLPATVYASQAIVTNSRVYLLGGAISGTPSAVVYTAPINSDGTLGTWTTGTSLPATVYYSQAIVTNSRVYLLGGTASAVVYTAPFADGWNGVNDATQINYTATMSSALPVLPSAVYKAGQYSQSSLHSTPAKYLNRYSSQNINKTTTVNDITGWTTGTSLPATVTNSHAIVTNSRVYMLGGIVAGSTSAVVYTAPINADGTLGTWTTGTSLPATFYQSQAIVTNSRVYLLGGSASAVVYTAPFADGWNGLNNNSISSANFITDTIATETLSSDQITMTCNTRLGDGRYVQTQIGMNNQDVSTELKATITF
jgi:N-acetylneuraminic acid mutarotase